MLHALLFAALLVGPNDPPAKAPATKLPVRITRTRTGGGPVGLADSVVVEKAAHRLTLYHQGRPIRC